jgi:hypothetical protein
MKTDRRDFLKVAGAGMITGALSSCSGPDTGRSAIMDLLPKEHKQHFNMSGFAAPSINVVRIGYIGIGGRGLGSIKRMRLIEGVEIKALCDIFADRVISGQQALKEMGMPAARAYAGSEDIWRELCKSEDLDLIYIATPRNLHPEMCVVSMENGKHAATEVPGVQSIEDAWRIVETSEKTKKHCIMLENCTYDFFELLVLNMARQGFLGEIVHADGGYIHDQREINLDKSKVWRLETFINRDGSIYPTHGLGPVCQIMNINRGDRLDFLTSMSSGEFTMQDIIAQHAGKDDFYQKYVGKWRLGNVNTSTIRTVKGKTIMLQYNISNPRPYSRLQTIVGTRGITQKYPLPSRIATGEEWLNDQDMSEAVDQYTPKIVKLVGEMAQKVGGHGGMDFLMEWRLIDCLRNGLPPDMDVYDAAAWSSIIPLSEWSVANSSSPVRVPDYTCGAYKTNVPVDIEMAGGGGNTGIRPTPVA